MAEELPVFRLSRSRSVVGLEYLWIRGSGLSADRVVKHLNIDFTLMESNKLELDHKKLPSDPYCHIIYT